MHRINQLEPAFLSRYHSLSESINKHIIDKKDLLLAQMHRVNYRMEEIQYVKTVIERDLRADFGESLEKLRNAERVKTSLLQNEMAELQKDLDSINDLVTTFTKLTQG